MALLQHLVQMGGLVDGVEEERLASPLAARFVRTVVVLQRPASRFERVAGDVVAVAENLLSLLRVLRHVAGVDELGVLLLVEHPVPSVASERCDRCGWRTGCCLWLSMLSTSSIHADAAGGPRSELDRGVQHEGAVGSQHLEGAVAISLPYELLEVRRVEALGVHGLVHGDQAHVLLWQVMDVDKDQFLLNAGRGGHVEGHVAHARRGHSLAVNDVEGFGSRIVDRGELRKVVADVVRRT